MRKNPPAPRPWHAKRENRLVSLVYLVCLVCLVEPDRPDRPDEPDQLSRVSPVPSVSRVSRGLALLDGHIRPAMLTGINLVRTEQFILAKLFKPMGQPPRHSSQSE